MKPVEFLKDIKIGFPFFIKDNQNTSTEHNLTVVRIGRKYFYCTDSVHSWEYKFELSTGKLIQQWGPQPSLFRSKQAYIEDQAKLVIHRKISKFFRQYNNTDVLTRTQLESILAIIGEDNV